MFFMGLTLSLVVGSSLRWLADQHNRTNTAGWQEACAYMRRLRLDRAARQRLQDEL